MGLEYIKEILARAATDKEFRDKLLNKETIDEVLKPYKGKLTQEEKTCLYELTSDRLEQLIIGKDNIGSYEDIRI